MKFTDNELQLIKFLLKDLKNHQYTRAMPDNLGKRQNYMTDADSALMKIELHEIGVL